MQLLIKNALIVHPASKHHGETTDIFIKHGRIAGIGHHQKVESSEIFDAAGACVSPGWLDLGTQVGDPGFEHREDFGTATKAAAAGGYTAIACLPNTLPAIHSKSEVLYVKNRAKNNLVDFLPIGAVSQDCQGKDITEMYDMHAAGATGFSDGKNTVRDSGLMMRALLYVQPFGGVILNHPLDEDIAHGGQMHEGVMSTSLGLRGIPVISEELMVQRDIFLAGYTGSRLHLLNISTAGSVRLVKAAKAKGIDVTASVAAMNLACDDSLLFDFDSNFKVMPPLRGKDDLIALRKGLKDGTIDCITSNHTPLDAEAKNLEFPFAAFGAIGLETAFALSNTHLKKILSTEQLVEKLAIGPRKILGVPVPEIAEGATACLTIFDPEREWTFTEKDICSKSKNTPFKGWNLKGKVLAIVRENHFSIVPAH
jgi:dihydroorotase